MKQKINDIKNTVLALQESLREVINSWELIPGSPEDEYDSLNAMIISVLYNQRSTNAKVDIQNIIYKYLSALFDEFTIVDANSLASEVMDWWGSLDKE